MKPEDKKAKVDATLGMYAACTGKDQVLRKKLTSRALQAEKEIEAGLGHTREELEQDGSVSTAKTSKMNLYLLDNPEGGDFDTYLAMVVAAVSEEEARTFHPRGIDFDPAAHLIVREWPEDPADLVCTYLGTAKEGTEKSIILTKYRAG